MPSCELPQLSKFNLLFNNLNSQFIMKSFKYLPFWLCMLMMCFTMSSCSSDDGPDGPVLPPLTNSRWTFTNTYQQGDETVTEDYSISFAEATATYQVLYTYRKGSQTQSVSDFANYTYTYSDGLVVMKPQSANYAYLEGKITSNVKMEVKNVSSGKIIGVFYRQQ